MRYLITMTETDYFHAVIEANSREEAIEKAGEIAEEGDLTSPYIVRIDGDITKDAELFIRA